MASPEVDVLLVQKLGFAQFVKLAWHVIEAQELEFEPHMQLMCAHCEAVEKGEIKSLVCNVPPGTSKSRCFSILFPAWAWTKDPTKRFMFVAYDKDLSLDFARICLKLIQSPWYQARWPMVIEGGERAPAGHFKNSFGGSRFSTMMGGPATGSHCHILIIDDPVKPKDLDGGGVSAMAKLDEAWQTITGTFFRRVANARTFAKICVMQRLHMEDPAGRMIRAEGTVHLSLPMRFEPNTAYRSQWGSDWRTTEGELLCPERFPEEYVWAQQHGRDGLSSRDFAAQYQQRPVPEQGSLFQRSWFDQQWSSVPVGMRIIMSVDSSLKAKSDSDYCVIQVWGAKGGDFWLLDQHRARMTFSETIDAIRRMKAAWGGLGQILIEDKANGTAIVDHLKGIMSGVVAVNPEGGKEARARAIEPFLRAGNCHFPNRPWVPAFVDECVSFPAGAYDDVIDCMSQALIWLSGKSRHSNLKRAMENLRNGRMNLTNRPTIRYR